ncbi:twin-arginine translocase TatA/TatE family subunit [Kineococcus sp. SYSU DK002]|uniref:twin-arginine translocase TatA/TatE family subunit n=1 Tax=Kineococcus sp. SYSU DK002 TaxID=3383123 RepID=UPI003D7D9783
MFGINGGELIVLLVVALVVLGPERLPHYAEQLAGLVKSARRFAKGAQAQMREELGPEFDDIDWQKLDPRQYDPRRIVRDALTEAWDDDEPAPRSTPAKRSTGGLDLSKGASAPAAKPSPVPYDEDAT